MSDRIVNRQSSATRTTAMAAVALLVLSGCFLFHHARTIPEPVELIAVLPIDRAASAADTSKEDKPRVEIGGGTEPAQGENSPRLEPGAGEPGGALRVDTGPQLAPDAEHVLTAQIYGVLSRSSEWRFVPDLTAAQALPKISRDADAVERARALGRLVNADAVLCGTVSRYVERIGNEFGARQPAAVSFTLQLVSVSSGTILWKGSFDQTQQPLSSNLFNWWQFWQGGPKWFSAEEFSRLGVEHLLADLARQLGY